MSNDTCCNFSVADLFNRWWLPGTPPPTSGYLLTSPYYEIMVAGNVWLPEDVLYGLAKHSDMDCNTDVRHMGQWGTAAGGQLRAFMQAAGRPLIWADSDDSEMLIDPTVGNIVGGRITAADIAGWEALGKSLTDLTPLEQAYRFYGLAESAPPHLKLRCPLWATRNACAQEELDPLKMVMGTDGNGDCVCWDASRPERWELLNDGGCAASDSPRAQFSSLADCVLGATQTKWVASVSGPPSRGLMSTLRTAFWTLPATTAAATAVRRRVMLGRPCWRAVLPFSSELRNVTDMSVPSHCHNVGAGSQWPRFQCTTQFQQFRDFTGLNVFFPFPADHHCSP